MKMHHVLIGLLCLCLSACATNKRNAVVIPEPLEEIQTVEDTKPEAGSLWNPKDRSMFSDRKAMEVGDILTVVISESATANKSAATSTDRDSSISAGISKLFGLETLSIGDMDFDNMVSASMSNAFDGNGSTARSDKLEAYLSTQVIGKYPNGQLKIRGGKEVMVNNEVQIIYLTGIVRPVDITSNNTIDSHKILNARISYTGEGVISDKQEPGWLTRGLDHIWPF